MSSKRKIDSARANGNKSHGPISGQGRKTSSMNALKHGFTARTVVFANENQYEYDALLLSYVHDLHPADSVEMDHVVDMVNAKWQQRRLNNSETQCLRGKWSTKKKSSIRSTISTMRRTPTPSRSRTFPNLDPCKPCTAR
jgi:hypothetical protein